MGGCRAAALTAALMVLASAAAKPSMCAEVYPDRPVKLVTQGAAGSGPDVIGRIVSDHLGRLWGQQIVIINQPGAGGSAAARMAAGAAPKIIGCSPISPIRTKSRSRSMGRLGKISGMTRNVDVAAM